MRQPSMPLRVAAALAMLLLTACAAKTPAPRTLCTGEPLTKGPWVMRVGLDEATVFWESRAKGCSELALRLEGADETSARLIEGEAAASEVTVGYGPEVGFKPADEPGTFHVHSVRATGLEPGRCYAFHVSDSGRGAGRFCTARPAGTGFTFAALGDTSTRWEYAPKVIAQTVARRPDFVLHLGDLQYYSVILETWQSWFGVMAPLLQAGAFLPSVGNHEFEIEDEFPNYYERLFATPGAPEAQGAGESGTTRWYTFSSGGVHFFSLDSESPLEAGTPQHTWLSGALAKARQTEGWRASVAYLHRPPYTLGRHAPRLDLRAILTPLFTQHGVSLVLTAHVHGYERFEADGITWIVSGGGGAPLYDMNANVGTYPDDVPLRKAVAQVHHAVLVTVEPAGAQGGGGTLRGECVDLEGEVCDTFTVPLQ